MLKSSCLGPTVSTQIVTNVKDDDPCMSLALEYDCWFCCASELGPPRI